MTFKMRVVGIFSMKIYIVVTDAVNDVTYCRKSVSIRVVIIYKYIARVIVEELIIVRGEAEVLHIFPSYSNYEFHVA